MSSETHVIEVEIFGQSYPIRTSLEDEEYVREIARYVDEKMYSIEKTLSNSSTSKVAILTALNIADELFSEVKNKERMTEIFRRKVGVFAEKLDSGLQS